LLAAACGRTEAPALSPEDIYNSEGLVVITSSFNTRQQTMSTLYGNAMALKAAAGNIHQPGEEYRLVTWKQRSHPFWFGSNKNGRLMTVERVSIKTSADGEPEIGYELVQGTPEDVPGGADQEGRMKFIFRQNLSVLP
jgi:ribosomal protein L31